MALSLTLLTRARLAGARPLLLERPVRVRGEDDRDPTRVDVLPPGRDVYIGVCVSVRMCI